MRNKLNLNEGEIQRILSLHKNALLKESGKSILKEENTVTLKAPTTTFEPKGSWSNDDLKLYKGTTFKPSTKIKNSLITTRKVTANFVQYGAGGRVYADNNKAFVVYNCKTKNFYLIGSTDENNKDRKDYKFNNKAIWYSGGNMQSLDKLCQESVVRDEVVVKPKANKEAEPEKEKEQEKINTNTQTELVRSGTSGNRYTFDFETIMKAIDDTGKCPRSGTSTQSGTSGTSGTQGTSGSGSQVVVQEPVITKDDFIKWTMD
jgi:hypothetical protein